MWRAVSSGEEPGRWVADAEKLWNTDEHGFLFGSALMLAKRIIPCLDVDNGRVVKGIRFVSLTDAGDPVAQAKR